MSGQGSWKKIPLSNAGETGVILSGDAYDTLVTALNIIMAMEVSPMSNCGRLVANEGQVKLDLMDIDNRLRALESRVNVTGANVTCVGSNIVITYT